MFHVTFSDRRCEAYTHMVISDRGFCHFDLSLDRCGCPVCREEFEPVTCAFRCVSSLL